MERQEQKNIFQYVVCCTFIFGVIAHGYCYYNIFFSHDSLMVYQNDLEHQVSIGRFLQPLYWEIRGHYPVPALTGALSLAFLALAIYLIVRMMALKDRTYICLACGILTASATVTLLNATYISYVDMFMLALLLAVWSVFVCRGSKYGFFPAGVILCLSLGIYQSYFQTAVFLYMMLAVKDLFDGRTVRQVLFGGGVRLSSRCFWGLSCTPRGPGRRRK